MVINLAILPKFATIFGLEVLIYKDIKMYVMNFYTQNKGLDIMAVS